jgi:hypothetical protein
MKVRTALAIALATSVAALDTVVVVAQGRGAVEWTTTNFDAQRTASLRTDPRISVETLQKPAAFGPFKFLWKIKLEYEPDAPAALTQPILLDRLIGFRGFKSIAFVATASETVHAIDVDLGVPLWKYHINYSASLPPVRGLSADCPGGLSAALSRPTAIAPSAIGGGGFGGGRGGRSGGGVGEPGQGSITLATAGRGRGTAPGTAPSTAVGAPGTVPGSAAAAAGAAPGGLPAGARAGGPGGGSFVAGADAAYVVGSDGYLHALNVQNGWDNMTPALFLPANTRATGLIVATTADGSAAAYATTTHGCGSQPDGVWAMDLASAQKSVAAFQVKEASIAGNAGPSFGRDGIVYVATTDGTSSMSNTIFALEPKTLKVKTSATVAKARFGSSPLVIQSKNTERLIAAGGGKLMLFESGSLAGGPIATSPAYAGADVDGSALASWEDAQGVRWIAASSPRGIVAMKIGDQSGRPSFLTGWTSRDIPSPLSPIVVNGVLFAASRGTRTVPAVLYAMEAATGKELWNSGKMISSQVRGGLSAGQGNVYVPGTDGTLYAFGFDIAK